LGFQNSLCDTDVDHTRLVDAKFHFALHFSYGVGDIGGHGAVFGLGIRPRGQAPYRAYRPIASYPEWKSRRRNRPTFVLDFSDHVFAANEIAQPLQLP